MQKPILKTLKNGLRILMVPLRDSVSASISIFVEAGSAYETKDNNGISHFLEHMCFKGTTKRPTPMAIATEMEGLGASYNAFTDRDMTGYYAKVAPKHLKRAYDIVVDMYLNPLVQKEELEKEKGVIIEEIHMYNDSPRSVVWDTLIQLMYGDQPAGWNIAGTPKHVQSMTREHFIQYRDRHYIPNKTIIVVAGAFDEKEMMQMIKRDFDKIPSGKRIERTKVVWKQSAPRLLVTNRKLDQTHLLFGFNTVPYASKDAYKLSLLGKVLGGGMSSRLFQVVREELGAAYYVGAGSTYYATHGYLSISAGVAHTKLHEAINAIKKEIEKIKAYKVEEKELQRAKDYSIGNFLLSLETPNDLAFYYADDLATLGEIETPQEVVKKIKAVTIADIHKMANKYLVSSNLNFSIIGPYGEKERKEIEKIVKS